MQSAYFSRDVSYIPPNIIGIFFISCLKIFLEEHLFPEVYITKELKGMGQDPSHFMVDTRFDNRPGQGSESVKKEPCLKYGQ